MFDEVIIPIFMLLLAGVFIVLMGAMIHECCMTMKYGPKYYCDEYGREVCEDTFIMVPIDDKGNFIMMPQRNCHRPCLKSHKNSRRQD